MSSIAPNPEDDLTSAKNAGERTRGQVRRRPLVALFATVLFTSAFLMFVIEPMIARMLLPMLGGAPAVWNTCLVFFQAMLLAGYAYAHAATHYLGVRRHAVVHSVLILLPLLALPIGLQGTAPSSERPMMWLLRVLFTSIGLPFFVLSTSAAVLQKWFSSTEHEAAADPYFLYTASNVGSFVALLAYPAVIEPSLRLHEQSRLWTMGYMVFATLTMICAGVVARRPGSPAASVSLTATTPAEPLSWKRRLGWIALAFVPSSLLLAVTNYITTDVASFPLLWIIPLSLYLLGFVLAFSARARRAVAMARRSMLILVVLTLASIAGLPVLLWTLPLHLVTFFTVALVCHANLADDRPSTERLTEFYLWIAFGGVVGGLFNTLLAPLIFTGIGEYPLVLVSSYFSGGMGLPVRVRKPEAADSVPVMIALGLVAAWFTDHHFGEPRYLVLAAPVAAIAAFTQRREPIRFAASIAPLLVIAMVAESPFGRTVYAARTFFGVSRVQVSETLGYRYMFHGTTLHGMESLDPARRLEPTSYYHRSGPIGQVFAGVPQVSAASNVAVVGLGAGTLAAYHTPSQHWTYYEIDPEVERIARNESYFSYLSACADRCRVIMGDGRLSMGRAEPHIYGLIVLDAFSSDAVPTHLMTKEALALYLSKLAPGGVIAFHISNRYFSFSSILARLASDAGLVSLWQQEGPEVRSVPGRLPSAWFVMARDRVDFGTLASDSRWNVPIVAAGTPLWADDFSNILSALE